jgi:hypothetical protein
VAESESGVWPVIKISIKTLWQPQQLIKAAEKARLAVFRRGGAIVAGIMKRSMKSSRKISAPGSAPAVHSRPGIKGLIRFDATAERVIIGPMYDASKAKQGVSIPFVLEHGGTVRAKVKPPSQRGEPRAAKLARKSKMANIKIRKRPFAKPTLEKFQAKYPEIWRNCIK